MIKKYRKKPTIVEAIQITPNTSLDDVLRFINGPSWMPGADYQYCKGGGIDPADGMFKVKARVTDMVATQGDYIVKTGVTGDLCVYKPNVFEKIYEKVYSGEEKASEERRDCYTCQLEPDWKIASPLDSTEFGACKNRHYFVDDPWIRKDKNGLEYNGKRLLNCLGWEPKRG